MSKAPLAPWVLASRRLWMLLSMIGLGKQTVRCEECGDHPVDLRVLLRMQAGQPEKVVDAICPRCRARRT